MAALVDRESVAEYLAQCLDGKYGPLPFIAALRFATERAYGRLRSGTEQDGSQEPLTIVLTRE